MDAVIDFQKLFEQSPGLFVVLDTDFNIVTCTNAYNKATYTDRQKMKGTSIFDLFVANKETTEYGNDDHWRAALNQVLETKTGNSMAIQRFDLRRGPDAPYEERYWSPCNTPILDDNGNVLYVIHEVEDVTDFILSKKNKGK